MNKSYEPNDKDRELVKEWAAIGLPIKRIAKIVGLADKTLQKYYQYELDSAADVKNNAVVGALYKNAIEGNVTAQIFWCKVRLLWKEVNQVNLADSEGNNLNVIVNVGKKEASE